MIQSCWCCMYKCPNSGDLDMEPSLMYYWVKDLMVPQQIQQRKGGLSSLCLKVTACTVVPGRQHVPNSTDEWTFKSTKLRRRWQCPHWFETQGLDHSIAYTEAHRVTVNLPQPSPSSYVGIECVFSDTFCTQARKLP